ncbi:MAG: MBL fold metallo-hydrolase [Gemmatimonadaceae bacterium]
MRLTTVGTGMAAPHPTRVQSGYLIETASVRLLIDCGSGVVHRMASLGLPWPTITHLAITHFDADHVSDIATLFIAWQWGQIAPRREPLEVIGPVGTNDFLDRLAAALWSSLRSPGFPMQVREIPDGEEMTLGSIQLAARKVPHTAESVAYSMATATRRLVYTGDTGYDESLARWAMGCDVLLCECSLPEQFGVRGHLTPEECGAFAALAVPKHLVLTHLYPPVEALDVRRIVGAYYGGPITLATDGWAIDLEDV